MTSFRNDFLATEHEATSDNQLFLVFDGIDEAERGELEDFLKLVSRSILAGTRIQILLVGRPEMNSIVVEKFHNSPFNIIEVSSKVNVDDVTKFSQARYDELVKIPKPSRGFISYDAKCPKRSLRRRMECFCG